MLASRWAGDEAWGFCDAPVNHDTVLISYAQEVTRYDAFYEVELLRLYVYALARRLSLTKEPCKGEIQLVAFRANLNDRSVSALQGNDRESLESNCNS